MNKQNLVLKKYGFDLKICTRTRIPTSKVDITNLYLSLNTTGISKV